MYGWRTREDRMIAVWDLPTGPENIPMLSAPWKDKLETIESEWGDKCRIYGQKHGVPDGVGQAMILRESGGNKDIVSFDHGVGLLQITNPSLKGAHSDEELKDPDLNLDIGFKYIAWLWKKYDGDFPKVSAAFNAGSVRTSTQNPWNMVQTNGHVSFEVAAYNTWLARPLSDEAKAVVLASVGTTLHESSDDFARGTIGDTQET
jgi:soluble lytic murein transglycosylase-like protein